MATKLKWGNPRYMWAYRCIYNGEIDCFTSQKQARDAFSERGESKRIVRVKIQIESSKASKKTNRRK